MKKCTICKEEKNLDVFYRDKRAKDGLYSCCKSCMDIKNAEWRNKNPIRVKELKKLSHIRHKEKERDYAREYARKLRKENYEKYRVNKDRWEKENPEKVKEIRKKAAKKFYLANYEKLYKLSRKWAKENPEKIKEYRIRASKLAREKWPEKNKARKLASYAVKIGVLIKPGNCSECLKECKPEGHHPDYGKPLEVIWLCRECHNKTHGKN